MSAGGVHPALVEEIDMDADEADDIYNEIVERLKEVESEYVVERLVLGTREYKALCVIAVEDYGQPEPESYFDSYEMVVVPGSKIAPVKPTSVLYTEYLR